MPPALKITAMISAYMVVAGVLFASGFLSTAMADLPVAISIGVMHAFFVFSLLPALWGPPRGISDDDKYAAHVVVRLRRYANDAVKLGLIGTVFGFMMSLGAIDLGALSDITTMAPVLGGLLSGMGIAMWTTLCGAGFNVVLTGIARVIEDDVVGG